MHILRADVVAQNLLEKLLGRLGSVFWDLLESTVGGCEQGEVGLGAVECLDNVWEFINPLSQLSGVVGGGDELVDSHVGLVVERRAMVRWSVVVATSMVWWVRAVMVVPVMRRMGVVVIIATVVWWMRVIMVVISMVRRMRVRILRVRRLWRIGSSKVLEQVHALHINLMGNSRVEPSLSIESCFVESCLGVITNLLHKLHGIIKSMPGCPGQLLIFVLSLVGDTVKDLGDLF